MSADAVTADTIRALARLQGLDVPEEDLEPLAAALSEQIAAGVRIVERYGDSEAEPPLVFDPRWD